MTKQDLLRTICLSVLSLTIALGGCKKHVAGAVPVASPVQPALTAPSPAIALLAAPATIDRGQAVSLQWEAKNAISVRIEPELGTVQTQGSRTVSPASSVTYTATATGPGGTASDTARITVRILVPPSPVRARPDAAVNVGELFRKNVQAIYFDYDKAELRPDQISRIQTNASWLREHRGLKFAIEGNCDERGSEEYNLGLGDRRANVVKEFLIREGVDPSTINTISYGDERPVCKETTEDCYQRNRRAEFALSPTS